MDRCTGRHCRPVLQLPTGQFCSWQTAGPNKLLNNRHDDPGAHGNETGANDKREMKLNGAKQLNGGKNVDEGQWVWQAKGGRQTKACRTGHCRRTQPADSSHGTGLKTNDHSWPALQQKQPLPDYEVGLSPCR